MKHIALLLSATLLVAFAGCTAEDEQYSNTTDNTITVSTYVGAGTRAIDKNAFAVGDAIGLYACQTTGNYANTYTANFMDNVTVTREATEGWVYSPLMSWPTSSDQHLSFIAYYPQQATSSPMTYELTLDDDFTQQIDPLFCTVKDAHINDRNGTAINGNQDDAAFEATTGSLNLKFQHMLSKILVKAKLSSAFPGVSVTIDKVELQYVCAKGSFIMQNDLSKGVWNLDNSIKKTFTLLNSPKPLTTAETAINELLVIPQPVANAAVCMNITYSYTLTANGTTDTKTVNKTYCLPYEWEVHKSYQYTINITPDVEIISVATEIAMRDNAKPHTVEKPADAIDLGLPSGTKWASYNYGTDTPYRTFVAKFSTPTYYASRWGEGWAMPTYSQVDELIKNCTVSFSTENGVNGLKVVGPNGNSIFLAQGSYWFNYNNMNYYYFTVSNTSIYISNSSNSSGLYNFRFVYTR